MCEPYSGSVLPEASWLEATFSEQNPDLLVVTRGVHDGSMHQECPALKSPTNVLVILRQRLSGDSTDLRQGWIQRGCMPVQASLRLRLNLGYTATYEYINMRSYAVVIARPSTTSRSSQQPASRLEDPNLVSSITSVNRSRFITSHMNTHYLGATLGFAVQHDLFIKTPPYAVLTFPTFLVIAHSFLYDRSLLSQDLEGALEHSEVLPCADGSDDLTFVRNVLRASKGSSEIGRERTERPGGWDEGEYLRDQRMRQSCQSKEGQLKDQCNDINVASKNMHRLGHQPPRQAKIQTTKALTSRVSSLFACELRNRTACCVSLYSAAFRHSVCSSMNDETHPSSI